MLETIVVVLLILWLLGVMVVPATGNAVHVLLVVALAIVVFRMLRGDRL